MKETRNYTITEALLKEYYKAALQNSRDIISEAEFLLNNKYFARSYFLSCLSIEESGKALQAFLGLGRNFYDPAVQTKLKKDFEDHSSKNISGLVSLLYVSDINKEEIKKNLDFILKASLDLVTGREKSINVDILENGKITIPNNIVSEKTANDTLRLATEVLRITKSHIDKNEIRKYSSYEDKFYTIPTHKITKILNNKDFWFFFLDEVEKKLQINYPEIAVKYWELYYSKNKKYKLKT